MNTNKILQRGKGAKELKERPILFSGEMVRALLAGRKTQTRRVVKDAALDCCGPCGNTATGDVRFAGRDSVGNSVLLKCPYGEPGDRLWVRETFGTLDCHHGQSVYRADEAQNLSDMRWKPSMIEFKRVEVVR